MVLKTFIHFVINKYLKNYVERLDYEKLKFNLKNGNVLLENVHLKREALAYLNIPVTVVVGYIEQLKLIIPWKSLTSKPTEVHIDGFYLLIVSKNEFNQDLSEHYADKMVRVQQKVDNLRIAALDSKKFDNKDSVFVERMRLQIKQNLVLKIRNLHICYERKSPAKLGHPFSFGITLHYLELTTVTNIKTHRRIKGNTSLTYKIKEINSLSIYWNTKSKSRQNLPFNDVLNDLRSKVATNNYKPNDEEMSYILRPVNLVTESLIILKPKEHHYERSTLIFDIQIEQINFHIDTKQISDMLDFVKFQNYTTIYDRCREYRELLRQHSIDNTSLSQDQKQRIQFLESKLDVFHLAYIRHKLEMEMYFFSPVMEENNNQQQMEIDQIPVSATTQTIDNHNNGRHRWEPLMKMKNKLNNLNKVLDHVKATTTAMFNHSEQELFFEDLPKFDIEILLSKVNFNILSAITNIRSSYIERGNEVITRININDAQLSLKRMSISSRVECVIDLQSLQISGMEYNKQRHSPLLVEMFSSSSPHVHIEFELFPTDQRSDYRLHLDIAPMKIIYDTPTINRLVESFGTNDLVIQQSETQLKQRTYLEMQRDCPKKKIFDLKINFKGVSLLLPQFGVYQQDFSMIRLNFGELLLKSCLDDDEDDSSGDSLFQVNERQFYIKYKLELTDLRILYTQSNKRRLYLLRRIPLIDFDFYKCKFSDDANLNKWRIALKTTMREIYLSKTILTKVIGHLHSIPVLYSNLSTIVKRINNYLVIFQPHTSLTIDISVYNCCLRLLTHHQRSLRTDFHIHISKKTNKNETDKQAIVILNEPTMIYHIFSLLKQSSQTFYRNDRLKLIYSSSATKL